MVVYTWDNKISLKLGNQKLKEIMALLIKDRELELVQMNANELRLEIAIMLYEKDKVSAGRASEFAGMNRILFLKELGKREIPVNYDEEELMKDLETLGISSDDNSQ